MPPWVEREDGVTRLTQSVVSVIAPVSSSYSDYPETPHTTKIAPMLRTLKFSGLLVVNVILALIGTAILNTPIGKVFPANSVVAVLWKEWILSIACAALIGFCMQRIWRNDVGKWTWILPALWFGIGFFLTIGTGAMFFQFSGTGCANGIRPVECRNFFVFAIPFIRGVSYSLGAYVSSLIHGAHSPAESMMPPSAGA
jgi:hypothetical protein